MTNRGRPGALAPVAYVGIAPEKLNPHRGATILLPTDWRCPVYLPGSIRTRSHPDMLSTTPGFTGPQILVATGAVATTIIGVGGAYRVLRGIVSAAFDSAVWESIKRKSPELEQHMRQAVFAKDLEAAAETHETVNSAMRLCESNAKAIADMVLSHQQLAAEVAELPRVSQALESVAEQLGRVSDKLDQVGTKVDYVHGMVDQLRVSRGVSIPQGAAVPI